MPKKKRGLRKGQNTWTRKYIKTFARGYHGEFLSAINAAKAIKKRCR